MKKVIVMVLLLSLLGACALTLSACDNPKHDHKNDNKYVSVDGTKIIDADGDAIGLYGTNLGGWFVQESWLVPTDVGAVYGQIDMMLTLANRFGEDGMRELLDVYEDNWVTELDFKRIKELGLNCVRIPFSYLNFMNVIKKDGEEYVRTPYAELKIDENSFARLDWAIEMCKKYELYAILDMHGAVGSQSGNDHTGDIAYPNGGQMWQKDEIGETCRAKTKELWQFIANRYKDETIVVAYDLLNEPGIKSGGNQSTISQFCQDYFDELYQAIRKIDRHHIITIESCWSSFDLPAPQDYGWENVIYQYHHYNWASSNIANSKYYSSLVAQNNYATDLGDYNVPVLIGEFNAWGDSERTSVDSDQTNEQAMSGAIELYCGLGWNFTTWNFKHTASQSSWGLFNYRTDIDNMGEQANFFTMTKEKIAKIWKRHHSQNYVVNESLVNCITTHLASFNTNGNDNRTLEEIKSSKFYYILTYDEISYDAD